MPFSTSSAPTPPAIVGELVEAALSFGSSASLFACLLLAVLTAFAIVAIATAPADKRSEITVRVLEVLSRTKHPPG